MQDIFKEPILHNDTHKLVLEYLSHYGYLKTLNVVQKESEEMKVAEAAQNRYGNI